MMFSKKTLKTWALLIILLFVLPASGFAQAELPGEDPLKDPFITFIQKPAGEVKNPVYFEFYASSKVEHYELIGTLNGNVYEDWTKLDIVIDNSDLLRPGYVKNTINDASPGTKSSIKLRACGTVAGPLGPKDNICGPESVQISWNIVAATTFTEPQIEFINLTSDQAEYPFTTSEPISSKISSVNNLQLNLKLAPSGAAEINETGVSLIERDGQSELGNSSPAFSCLDENNGWWSCESAAFSLNSTYRHHSLTVQVTDSSGKTSTVSVQISYYAPIHLEVKTHTELLGSLTPAQAVNDPLPPSNNSVINYDITLNASAVQGVVAKYALDDKKVSRIENFEEMGYSEGIWLPGRSSVTTDVFYLDPNGEQAKKDYLATWKGRVRVPTTTCSEFSLLAQTGEGDNLSIVFDNQEFMREQNTKADENYTSDTSFPTLIVGQWYPLEINYTGRYQDGSTQDDYLKLQYSCERGPYQAFSSQHLGAPILGAGEYIAPHFFEIKLSPEQLVNPSQQDLAVTVTPAHSSTQHPVQSTAVSVNPSSSVLLTEPNRSNPAEQQTITIALAAGEAMDKNNLSYPTSLKVGDDLKINFQVEALRAFEYATISPTVSGVSSHHDMFNLLSLQPISSTPLVDKEFKSQPAASLIVTDTAPGVGQTAVPQELYYQIVVGPQLDSLSKHCAQTGGPCLEPDTSYLNPFSVRPRSLFGASIPDLYISKAFVSGQGTYFQDPAAQYTADGSLYQIKDNNGEVPSSETLLQIRPFTEKEIAALTEWTGTGLNSSLTTLPIKIEDPVNPACISPVQYVTSGAAPSMLSLYNGRVLEPGPYLVNTGHLVLNQSLNTSANFHFSDSGTIAFGLSPADTQVACDFGTAPLETCATLWVAADMLVPGPNGEPSQVRLDPFVIHYKVAAANPFLNPSSPVATWPAVCSGSANSPASVLKVE